MLQSTNDQEDPQPRPGVSLLPEICVDQLAPIFTQIIKSLELSVVPSCFKYSTIIPIPKKACISGLNDYRGVSLDL